MNKMIPSEIIHTDENGNVTIGKNLEIDGKLRINNGLDSVVRFIFTDSEGVRWNLVDYCSISGMDYHIIELYNDNGDSYVIGIGLYTLDNQEISNISVLGYDIYNVDYAVYTYQDNVMSHDYVAYYSQTQPKLYTHTLTLTADKSYTLIYQSTSDLNVNSITDLRTIMNVKATSDKVILPVCASDLSGTSALQITTTLCKIGATNVTAISDKVTTL